MTRLRAERPLGQRRGSLPAGGTAERGIRGQGIGLEQG